MARRNNFLVVSLLVMVTALIAAILLTDGGDAPDPGSPTAASAGGSPEDAGVDPQQATADGGQATDGAVADTSRVAVEGPEAGDGARDPITLRGRVLDGAGKAVPDLDIGFRPATRFDFVDFVDLARVGGDAAPTTTRTDAEGRFAVRVEPGRPGDLQLAAETGRLFTGASPRRLPVAAYVEDTDIGDVTIRDAARLSGRVIDGQDQGLADARVTARPVGRFGFRETHTVTTAEDGSFTFEGLLPGSQRIHATRAGFVPESLTVELGAGDRHAPVTLQLGQGRSISGIVQDDEGRPIVGAKVSPYRRDEVLPAVNLRSISGEEAAVTGEDGRFVLSGIEEDSVSIRAWAEGHTRTDVNGVAIGADVLIQLDRLGRISGVLLAPDDTPLAGSRVVARAATDSGVPRIGDGFIALEDRGRSATTDEQGRFTIEGVRPGSVILSAEGSGHLPVVGHPVRVEPAGHTTNVVLRAETGAAIVASVVDSSGKPVPGAIVRVRRPEAEPVFAGGNMHFSRAVRLGGDAPSSGGFEAVLADRGLLGRGETDAEGRARIGGLPEGTVEVLAEHSDLAPPKPVEVLLPRRGVREVALAMRPAGFLELTSTEPSGEPLGQTRWRVEGPIQSGGDPEKHEGETDARGFARIGPLLPGTYGVALCLPPKAVDLGAGAGFLIAGAGPEILGETRREVVVRAGETTAVTLQRPILARVTGSVSDASGPVAGAQIRLERIHDDPTQNLLGGSQGAQTDTDGRFEIADVQPGSYRLEYGRRGQLVPAAEDLEIPPATEEVERDLQLRGGTVRVQVTSPLERGPLARAEVSLVPEGRPRRAVQRVMMIRMRSDDDSQEAMTMGGGRDTVRTDDDGVAVLEDVPPGEYTLVIEHRDHATERREHVAVGDGVVADVGVVELRAGGFLRGEVTGFPEGAMRGALLEVVAEGNAEPRRETTIDGRFRIDKLVPGRYRVRARRIGPDASDTFGPWVDGEVRAGETTTLTVPLAGG